MTPTLSQWAQRHQITPGALFELTQVLARAPDVHKVPAGSGSEAAAQAAVRLEAPLTRVMLWRNNNGAFVDERGVPVRYGLANDSAKLNAHVKSSDLIGMTQVVINHSHIGRSLPLFTAIEMKKPGWKWSGTQKEVAQKRFLDLVDIVGGVSGFVRGVDDFHSVVEAAR